MSVCSPHCPEDLKLLDLLATAAKLALEQLQLLPVDKHRVQHGISPCWLLSHLGKKVVVDTLMEPPELSVYSHVVPPACVRMVEVPHEDQGL